MPEMPTLLDTDKMKRILERFVMDAQHYIRTNFQSHPEAQHNANLRAEYVLDMAIVAELYQRLGLGNVYHSVQSRMTGVQALLEDAQTVPGLPPVPPAVAPSEEDLRSLLRPDPVRSFDNIDRTSPPPLYDAPRRATGLVDLNEADRVFAPPPQAPATPPRPTMSDTTRDEIRAHMRHNESLLGRSGVGQGDRGATPNDMEAAARVRSAPPPPPPRQPVPTVTVPPQTPGPARQQHWWDLTPDS